MWRYFLALVLLAGTGWADEEEAIAALKTSGVTITGTAESGRKVGISLDRDDVSLQRVKRLAEVKNVANVMVFNYRRKRDTLLPFLKTLPGVKKLELVGYDDTFNDADMKHVADMASLESVFISSDRITDKGLMELAKIKGLKSVTIKSDRVTQAGREKLNDALPKCVVK